MDHQKVFIYYVALRMLFVVSPRFMLFNLNNPRRKTELLAINEMLRPKADKLITAEIHV
jgi:hypothetical protein